MWCVCVCVCVCARARTCVCGVCVCVCGVHCYTQRACHNHIGNKPYPHSRPCRRKVCCTGFSWPQASQLAAPQMEAVPHRSTLLLLQRHTLHNGRVLLQPWLLSHIRRLRPNDPASGKTRTRLPRRTRRCQLSACTPSQSHLQTMRCTVSQSWSKQSLRQHRRQHRRYRRCWGIRPSILPLSEHQVRRCSDFRRSSCSKTRHTTLVSSDNLNSQRLFSSLRCISSAIVGA
jgi:hypothetical protein